MPTTKYAQINDLGVVQIQTTDDFYAIDPGLAGVAFLNGNTNQFLQSYTTLDGVARDYPAGTKVYSEAAAYFNNSQSPLFQVINYKSSSAQSASTNSTSTSSSSANTPSLSGSASTSNGSGSNNAAGTANSTSPVINVPAQDDVSSAISAVKKYYGAAWEHLIVSVDATNQDVAVNVAEFVEAQNNKLCYLEIPAASPDAGKETGPDFSFLKPLLPDPSSDFNGVLSTTAQSAPSASTDPNEYDLAGALLSVYANEKVGANPQFVNGLENFSNVRPQDFYEFVKDDLDKYYSPYNVWTYEYRNGTPMFSTNYSIGGYEIMPMLIRDAIIKEVKANILNLFEQNEGLQYDVPGVNMITDQITVVLNDFTRRRLIQNAKVIPVDPSKIKEATKATGHLSGLGWDWQPVWGINDVKFHQGIELPELN